MRYFVFGFGQFAAPQIQQREVEIRLGPVGIDLLGGDELRGGFDQGGLLLRRQCQEVGARQGSRRLDAHGSDGVVEQRRHRINKARRRRAWQGARRRHPDERLGIADRRLDCRLRHR